MHKEPNSLQPSLHAKAASFDCHINLASHDSTSSHLYCVAATVGYTVVADACFDVSIIRCSSVYYATRDVYIITLICGFSCIN